MPAILLAETATKASGLNPLLKVPKDSMRFCDYPNFGKGHDWLDEYKKMSDYQLFRLAGQLFDDLTEREELKAVARKMLSKLQFKEGGTFTDAGLNKIVANDIYFSRWVEYTSRNIKNAIIDSKGKFNFKPVSISTFAFTHSAKGYDNIFNTVDNHIARMGGLGILINQVYAATVEMEPHQYHINTSGTFTGIFKYTLYDDFGLDVPDIIKWENSKMPSNLFPPRRAATGFKAWFVLQRYKCFTPFITKIEVEKRISFKLSKF